MTPGFPDRAQQWRTEWLHDRQRVTADSLRAYVEFSSTRRAAPWDARFAPFDRDEKDGIHLVTRSMMNDKLILCNYHQRATKRLYCNLGLIGPTVTTKARWKNMTNAVLPVHVTRQDSKPDRTVKNAFYSDPSQS